MFRSSLLTYIVFICVFVGSLKQDFSFKNIQSWKQKLKCCFKYSWFLYCLNASKSKILVWSLPNIGLVLEWPPSSLRSFLMRRKNWRCGGGYNDGARELSTAQRQFWSSDDEAEIDEVGWFIFLRWKLHGHEEALLHIPCSISWKHMIHVFMSRIKSQDGALQRQLFEDWTKVSMYLLGMPRHLNMTSCFIK